MKKEKKIIVLVFTVLLALAAVVGGLWWMKNAKASWYDVNATEFTITTADELYDLAELSETYDFKGQTIKLGADIVVNEGDAEEWAAKAPRRRWHPITGFAGTFDGQGHSISGIYGDGIVTSMGLFTDTKKSSVIRDFQLVNSYFKNGNDKGTGSIIGFGGGILESVYSDAIVEGTDNYVGGLIGKLTVKAENTISNCWFDGTINMRGNEASYVGGIVGSIEVADAMNLIEHSLNTGDITSEGSIVGGICGSVSKGGFLRLDDSMSSGAVTYGEESTKVGSVLGQVDESSSAFIADTYTVKEIKKETIGTTAGTLNGNVIAKKAELLTGFGGYQWTTLDFDNYWAVKLDETPVLMSFAKEVPSLAGITKKIDMSWYDKNQKEFVLTTAEQLYGFAFLSISEAFNNQTIKLGADIVINEGDSNEWGENPPVYDWSPIGWHGANTGQHFTGTFDGQGHTISGIYVKGDENEAWLGLFGEIYRKGTLKNLTLTNSYIEGTRESSTQGVVGSVAGRNLGTIDTVYTDAIVTGTGKFTGGIVGMITGDGENLITNCWYDGKLYGAINSGGIVGGVYGDNKNITVTIEHCLNTGTLTISDDASQIGGLCGVVQRGSTLNLNDSLNSGTIVAADTVKIIGSAIGLVAQDSGGSSSTIANSVYGVEEFYKKIIGSTKGNMTGHCTNIATAAIKGNGGYLWTTLDFNNYWAIRRNDTPILASFADSRPSVSGIAKMVDTSWYSADKKEFIITNAAQLYGFAQLSKVTDFSGKTIKLGADITINQGSASEWAEKVPAYAWTPIGYQGSEAHFSGTFDGQGHTISGIYVKGTEDEQYLGLFGEVYRGAVVKNVKLTNSYIEGTRDKKSQGAVGSIAGRIVDGTITGVYSDAIVVNSARSTGGIVGLITDDGNNKISNCWFAGELHGYSNSGGIAGTVYGNDKKNTTAIEHCLNTGTLYMKDGTQHVGGLCGGVSTGGVLKLTDSLNAGTIETDGKVSRIGNAIGIVAEKSSAQLSKVYGNKEFASKNVNRCDGQMSEAETLVLAMDNLLGYSGYRFTQLDFDNYWATQKVDAAPVLSYFVGSDKMDMTGVIKADTGWYNENDSKFTIKTPEELYGFALLSKTYDFEGQTVRLGRSITINSGIAADWAENPPVKNEWLPIGWQGSGTHFKGTFDGQGNSISGIYVKGAEDEAYLGLFGEIYRGATVKNLTIANSYIEGTMAAKAQGCVGSLAGRVVEATIDAVYSDAIVVNNARMTGGLVGLVTDDGKNTFSNCWYAGKLYGFTNSGGIVGCIYGNNKDNKTTMEHCLNTGTLSIDGSAQTAQHIGGICGAVSEGGVLVLKDSLNNGLFESTGKVSRIGNALGLIAEGSKAQVSEVYGITEFASKIINRVDGQKEETNTSVLDATSLKGYSGYRLTKLNFEKFWVTQSVETTPVLSKFAGNTNLDMSVVITPDTSWYNENDTEFTLTEEEQLFGLSELSKTYTFENQVIKLGADMYLNGNKTADEMEQTPPANAWTPIGLYNTEERKEFKGLFDGDGHTIYGIYTAANEQCRLGLFGTVGAGGTIIDLTIKESYFNNSYSHSSKHAYMGSVAGVLHGTLDTVKSEATLVNNGQITGGLVGAFLKSDDEKAAYLITNCWFDGNITGSETAGNSKKYGGIVGAVDGGVTAQIEHSLNSGDIHMLATTQQNGGLCGAVINKSKLNITDSLNVGTLTYSSGTSVTQTGSIIGLVNSGTSATLANVYGHTLNDDNTGVWKEVTIGSGDNRVTGEENSAKSTSELTGNNAYMNMNLSFCLDNNDADDNRFWIVTDNTPVLRSFKGDVIAHDATTISDARTVWFEEDTTKYILYTQADLYGLTYLSADESFAGKTIELGTDITLNDNLYERVENGDTTLSSWTPIGLYNDESREAFKGIFDGKNHTISGIYVNSNVASNVRLGLFGTVGASGIIQNLQITESYFKDTGAGNQNANAFIGSVAGVLYGTLDTVKSDAKVESNSQYNGGLVGAILGSTDGGEYTINNCWFAGTITSSNDKTAGLVGGVNGNSIDGGIEATISHSLNSGTVHIIANKKQIGGFCGVVLNNVTLKIVDSLNTGTLLLGEGVSVTRTGAIVGLINAETDSVELENVYGYATEDMWNNNNIGYGKGYATGTHEEKSLNELKGDNTKDLALDFYDSTVNTAGYWIVKDANSTPVLCVFEGIKRTDGVPITPDTTWYNTEDTSFDISTVAQLYGLAVLSREYDFEGQTFNLLNDIVLNNKTAEQMAAKAPINMWEPIGKYKCDNSEEYEFKGTFDGHGYTISGIYAVNESSKTNRTGLFGTVGAGGTVQNLKIAKSYFKDASTGGKNDSAYMGSVTGVLHGNINTIYSEATLESNSQFNGGLVGRILASTAGGENDYTIRNCWFNGTISSSSQKNAGIVSSVSGTTAYIKQCLNSGTINLTVSNSQQNGGICGVIQSNATLNMQDVLNVGILTGTPNASNSGSVIGLIDKGTVYATNVYGYATENVWDGKAIGKQGSNTVNGSCVVKIKNDLSGLSAENNYKDLAFVFSDESGAWTLNNGQPVLYDFKNYLWTIVTE